MEMDKENQSPNESVLDSWEQALEKESKECAMKSEASEKNIGTVLGELEQYKIDENETEVKPHKESTKKSTRKEKREKKQKQATAWKKVHEPVVLKEDELFIKNLEQQVDEEELLNQFKQFGTITRAQVARDMSGKSKCFAFVCFSSQDEANQAMSEMNGQMIREKAISVSFVKVKPGQEPKQSDGKQYLQQMQGPTILKQNELHISNLEDWVDNNELINRFKQFGTVREARVVRDKSDKSKGFAFLCFDTHDEANKAMSEMNGRMIGDKLVSMSYVEQKPGQRGCNPMEANKQYKKDRIFVKNLDKSVTEEELKSLFIQFGNIVEAKVLSYEDSAKNKGLIQFFSYKAAEKAVVEMNGRMIKETAAFVSLAEFIPGKTKPLKPKPALPLPIKKDNVLVSNLPTGVTDSKLKDIFSRFGSIVQIKNVPTQHLAYVQFVLAKDAQKAVNLMNGHILDSRPIKVSLAIHKPGKSNDPFYMPKKPSNNLFYTPKKTSNKSVYDDMY